MASKLAGRLVSLLVPPVCACCREPELSGAAVCPSCRARLVGLAIARCGHCGAPGRDARRCSECRGRALAFRSAWAPFEYEGTARRLVAALKSGRATAIATTMAAEIATRAPQRFLDGTLVPVPAHRERRHGRGFNQAALLARSLARARGQPMAEPLLRTASARPQVGLERRARILAARGSVVVGQRLPSGAVVLVDDVYTTGATLDACAAALRTAGVEDVLALTFARTVRALAPDGRPRPLASAPARRTISSTS